ncbi:MAG: 30S ribosomal protein S4 [Limnochordaceae bacterium]|nr:30S ribosomal protein S4 [Limnochordaceae bacterium]
MARYTESVCAHCRREGLKLYLKGDRCYTPKCPIERRNYAPGQHGQGRRRETEYSLHLREKQKLRRIYGVLERQFRRYYGRAIRRRGITGVALMQMLELRLDNVVYRLGFGSSRPQARQLVTHGHIAVNGQKVDIPSYQVRAGDVISVREGHRDLDVIKQNIEKAQGRTIPAWLQLNAEQYSGTVLRTPEREEIQDVPVRENLVVEFYSR